MEPNTKKDLEDKKNCMGKKNRTVVEVDGKWPSIEWNSRNETAIELIGAIGWKK